MPPLSEKELKAKLSEFKTKLKPLPAGWEQAVGVTVSPPKKVPEIESAQVAQEVPKTLDQVSAEIKTQMKKEIDEQAKAQAALAKKEKVAKISSVHTAKEKISEAFGKPSKIIPVDAQLYSAFKKYYFAQIPLSKSIPAIARDLGISVDAVKQYYVSIGGTLPDKIEESPAIEKAVKSINEEVKKTVTTADIKKQMAAMQEEAPKEEVCFNTYFKLLIGNMPDAMIGTTTAKAMITEILATFPECAEAKK